MPDGTQGDPGKIGSVATSRPRPSSRKSTASLEALRRPLVLCALEGLTQVEAAQVLSCGEATVRRRLACAKERLRNRLDRRGVALLSSLGTFPAVPQSWSAGATKVALADATGLAVPWVSPAWPRCSQSRARRKTWETWW